MSQRRTFVTGTAGSVGFNLAQPLLREGWQVHGFDGTTDYHDVALTPAGASLLHNLTGC